MSKEIKEKCKMCRYYNDKQQYPNVDGQTTHSNCISIKCQYRKITKDMQIRKLTHENKILAKALELAVADKCKFENALLSTSLGITNGEVAVPKKEQWYLEQAEKEMANG